MKRGAFTLLELMIVISIIFLVSIAIYSPYAHYQQKSHLTLAAKQIAQHIQTARSSAVYGTASGSNLSFGLYLESGADGGVDLLSYSFSATGAFIDRSSNNIKDLAIERGVYIDSINNQSNSLLFFEAISGNNNLFYWDEAGVKQAYEQDILEIDISYKGASSKTMQKTILYYTDTNVIDY